MQQVLYGKLVNSRFCHLAEVDSMIGKIEHTKTHPTNRGWGALRVFVNCVEVRSADF
jgi:hypothetical protein